MQELFSRYPKRWASTLLMFLSTVFAQNKDIENKFYCLNTPWRHFVISWTSAQLKLNLIRSHKLPIVDLAFVFHSSHSYSTTTSLQYKRRKVYWPDQRRGAHTCWMRQFSKTSSCTEFFVFSIKISPLVYALPYRVSSNILIYIHYVLVLKAVMSLKHP